MPLSQFLVGNRKTARRPGEILTAILIPRELENAASVFLKLGARKYLVISISMVAAIMQLDSSRRVAEARVGVGSCSATAQRLSGLERELTGVDASHVGRVVQARHLQPLAPIDDVRATAVYRYDASLTLVRRALEACVASH